MIGSPVRRCLGLAALLASLAVPAHALGADSFTLVNRSGGALSDVSIRRTGGGSWKPVGGTLADGASAPIAFSDPDCAFDIQGSVGGQPVTWHGVNLCEVKVLILNRRGSTAWADYQ